MRVAITTNRPLRPNNLMKIAIVNNLYTPYLVGGAERSVQMLAEAFVAEGAQVSIITLHPGACFKRDTVRGVDVWRLPLRNGYWPFDLAKRSAWRRLMWHLRDIYNHGASRDLKDVLAKISPDVVHTNNLSGFSVSVWSAAKQAGIPIVHTARDYYMLHPNSMLYANGIRQDERAMVARLWSLVKKVVGRKVRAFVAISGYVKDIHLRNGHFPMATASVVHNSVELVAHSATASPKPKRANVFGFLGRLDPAKGVELILEAAALTPEVNWLIAGEGRSDYVNALSAAAPPNVTFVGRQDPAVFLGNVHVLVVPSMWAEPLGRVVLEAYAQGVPVLSSGLGGLKDIVEEGATGWHFDVTSASSLATAVARARSCDLQVMSKRCYLRAHDFSAAVIAAQYFEVFRTLAPLAARDLNSVRDNGPSE